MDDRQLRAALRRAVLAADPAAASRRRDDARADAAVTVWDEASGNAALAGRELPPAEVLTADARLTALAKWLQARGAPGTISQLRAAVYTALLNGRPVDTLLPDASAAASEADAAGTSEAGPASEDGVPGGAPAGPAVSGSIHLTMPLTAFLSSSGNPVRSPATAPSTPPPAATSPPSSPAPPPPVVPHPHRPRRPRGGHACAPHGPAAGQPVIRWAAGLRSRLQILETGSCRHPRQAPGYVPPGTLRHLIGVRQRRCSHPAAAAPPPAATSTTRFPTTRAAGPANATSRRYADITTDASKPGGWHLEQPRPGEMTWRTPSGRVYQTTGDPY